MFINTKTHRAAWLLQHDGSVTFSTHGPGDDRKPVTVDGAEFFQTHREATADEIAEHDAKASKASEDAAKKPAAAADGAGAVKPTI